jgi:hypothetical protein
MSDERLVTLRNSDPDLCRAALAGLANSGGGRLILTDSGDEIALHELAQQIDPPITGLIAELPADSSCTRLVHVRHSPHRPHIDMQTGNVWMLDGSNQVVALRTRAGLDRLYQQGGAAESRALRSIDGMVERVQLTSFGHYGIAIIVCPLIPSAQPFTWAAFPDELIDAEDPFIREWKLSPASLHVQPSIFELRAQGDVTGIVRVTRAGCVLAGEMRRKLSGDCIGSVEEQRERFGNLLGTVWRIMSRVDRSDVVTRFLGEGLRGTCLSPSASTHASPSKADSLDISGTPGDAKDPIYQRTVLDEFTQSILGLYGPAAS